MGDEKQEFCRQHGMACHETGTLRSYREILTTLHKVSAVLRNKTNTAGPAAHSLAREIQKEEVEVSYRTEFNLEIQEGGPTIDQVAEKLSETARLDLAGGPPRKEDSEFWASVITGGCPFSWWDHEKHLKPVSGHWPHTLFTLRGNGEDPGDQWVKYFLNRKVQAESPQRWPPPPFNPGKLR